MPDELARRATSAQLMELVGAFMIDQEDEERRRRVEALAAGAPPAPASPRPFGTG